MDERKLTRDFKDVYPSNSINKNEKKEDGAVPKKKTPIVKNKVIIRKKTLGKRIQEAFLGDDPRSVGDYLLQDIFMPAVKNTLSDLVGGGLDMWLFGERRTRNGSYSRRERGNPYTSYQSYYGKERDSGYNRRDERRDIPRSSRARHDFDDIVLDNRGEAEEVLSCLVEDTIDYGRVTVADYYDLINVESSHVDRKHGWTNLRDAYIERVRDGYIIRLPRTRVLD